MEINKLKKPLGILTRYVLIKIYITFKYVSYPIKLELSVFALKILKIVCFVITFVRSKRILSQYMSPMKRHNVGFN